jgi:EmrB/QacA subfamily drug resistance transporter
MAVMVMTPIDMSAVNVIIPTLQSAFHVPADQVGLIAWVVLAYLLVIVGLLLPCGRLGDLFGFRRLFLVGVTLFTTASVLCGLAPGLGWLIGARVLQGVGACMIMALSTGIVTAIFPAQERGRALGITGMGIAFGLVVGPTLGGLITHWIGWSWVFFINVPIGIAGGLWVRQMLPPLNPHRAAAVDVPGALLIIATLVCLMLGITMGHAWGMPVMLGLLAAAAGLGTLLAVVERRRAQPMLDFTLFRHPVFTGANLAAMMNYIGQFCAIFLTPQALHALGYDAKGIGLMMGAVPLAVLVLSPVSGALSDRLGTRTLAVAGETGVALGLLGLAAGAVAGRAPWMLAAMVLVGAGTGLFQSPNSSAIMGSLPRTHLGIGGSVLATMRNLGMALGIALSSAMMVAGTHRYLAAHPAAAGAAPVLHGAALGYLAGAGFALLGALTSAMRQDSRPVSAAGAAPPTGGG